MHKTIENAQKAIKESVDLLHTLLKQLDDISPMIVFPHGYIKMTSEPHQTANELTRLCLDASKKISIQSTRPCEGVAAVRQNFHDFGFVTALFDDHNLPDSFGGGPTQILLIAIDQKAIDIWLSYGLSTSSLDKQEHPFLVGWLLGYPTNSIENFWADDFDAVTLALRLKIDLEIYKREFGTLPSDSAGFNWLYELPA